MKVADLANYAQNRWIPMPLEVAWKKRTGVNPVYQAIVSEMEREMRTQLFIWGCVGISFSIFLYWAIDGESWGKAETQSFRVFAGAAVAFVLAGVSVLLVGFSFPFMRMKFPTEDAKAFCADFSCLWKWSKLGKVQDFALLDILELKAMASKILVEKAQEIHQLEDSETDPVAKVVKRGVFAQEFRERFNTLQRFDLTTGEYGKYFKEAKRLLKAEGAKAS